jgi:hypothetical protein
MSDKERIDAAVALALQYGQIDGSHHKTWVIDQMLRILSEHYDDMIMGYETEDEAGCFFSWDTGIAP